MVLKLVKLAQPHSNGQEQHRTTIEGLEKNFDLPMLFKMALENKGSIPDLVEKTSVAFCLLDLPQWNESASVGQTRLRRVQAYQCKIAMVYRI